MESGKGSARQPGGPGPALHLHLRGLQAVWLLPGRIPAAGLSWTVVSRERHAPRDKQEGTKTFGCLLCWLAWLDTYLGRFCDGLMSNVLEAVLLLA